MLGVAVIGVMVLLFVYMLADDVRERRRHRSPVQPADESHPRLLPAPDVDGELTDAARQLHDRIGADELAQALAWLDGPHADEWIARGLDA